MSNQHTPGPWMRTHGSGRYYIKTDKQSIATVFSSNGEFGCPTNPTSEQASANARLVAAAPELLEALGQILCIKPQHGMNPNAKTDDPMDVKVGWNVHMIARAAIAKATGGAA